MGTQKEKIWKISKMWKIWKWQFFQKSKFSKSLWEVQPYMPIDIPTTLPQYPGTTQRARCVRCASAATLQRPPEILLPPQAYENVKNRKKLEKSTKSRKMWFFQKSYFGPKCIKTTFLDPLTVHKRMPHPNIASKSPHDHHRVPKFRKIVKTYKLA